MPALWIAHADVTDPEAYGRYAEVASRVIPAHGGKFIARGGKYRQLEGRDFPRNVVARFPSFEAAAGCYDSPEYQEVAALAAGAAERSVVIVEIDE
ncbi:DUF1330 domain-containing protein [Rhodobacteraceae bacterium 2CG4]|uniref:DUF1330 domain-containing protein n=1 Tax=Halovulum marinum TaxID=2662447 RepID=A0A6L5Z4F4_9RHOB|nr:DUF1330 domain-containing protein [Halovulum marinum]MSU91433.1 DUF1330 domain-containing protein [Halovulum marinum]